jgi:hypothetical protein
MPHTEYTPQPRHALGAAAAFNAAMSRLDAKRLDHEEAAALLLRAWCSCPSRRTMQRARLHRRQVALIRLEQQRVSTQYHFTKGRT